MNNDVYRNITLSCFLIYKRSLFAHKIWQDPRK